VQDSVPARPKRSVADGATSAVSRLALSLNRVLLVLELGLQTVTCCRIVLVRLLHPLDLGFDGLLLALQ
jgi:hypothetical protein